MRLALPVFGVAAALVCAVPASSAAPAPYSSFDCSGAVSTFAAGTNDSGQVVGWFVDAGGTTHGFLRGSDGTCAAIDVDGAVATMAFGVNDPGQITGVYVDAAGVQHAFLYQKGTFLTVDYPDANICECYALGINSRGQVVGFYDVWDDDAHTACDGPDYAYVREPTGTFTRMTAAAGFPDSYQANGINPRGQIVGQYLDTVEGENYGFLRDANGAYTYPIDVPGAVNVMPASINPQGQIAGWYFTEPFLGLAGPCHGFFRDTDGTVVELAYPGAQYTCVVGLNAAGEVTGSWTSSADYDAGPWHGFIASKEALIP